MPVAPDAAATTTAVTPALDVPGEVAVVGASWPTSGDLGRGSSVQVRTRAHGVWGDWRDLDVDDAHGPDTTGPGAAEAKAARDGTEPFVVTDADAVQVRVDGGAPAPQTTVEVVDPGEQAADPTVGTRRPDAAAAATSQPTIYSRRQWGADESLRKGTPEYGSVQAAFVHHTVSANDYTAAEVPAIIRGIYRYHVTGRGWNDIGYNFLVDRFGRIWEGRYGGIALPVIGAHTQGYNSVAFAMSAIGNFDIAQPPAVVVDAYSRLFAWKLGLHAVPATGTVVLNGTRLNRISGHRDVGQTACPGRYLYAQLPTIRSRTAARMTPQPRLPVVRSLDAGGSPDLVVAPSATQPAAVLPEVTSPITSRSTAGTGWQTLRLVTVSPDLDGDGHPDLVATDSAGRLRVYRGDGAGGLLGWRARGSGWGGVVRLLAPGDFDGDGRADLLAVNRTGALTLYSGDGAGWISSQRVISSGWTGLSSVATGDVTGDGVPDLLGIGATDGRLYRYPGSGHGTITAKTAIGSGWNVFDALIGAGDLDGDGHVDVVAREAASGRMRTYYGTGTGTVSYRMTWGSGFGTLPQLTAGQDWDGDGHTDLIAVRPSGDLAVYHGSGRRAYDRAAPTGLALTGADTTFVVGDVDHDGHADVLARRPSGDLYLYPGSAAASSTATSGRLVGHGWQGMTLLAPAGDLDRDGTVDVLARDSAGVLWIYPMTPAGGFLPRRELGTGWQIMSDIVGVGAWDGDAAPDVMARTTSGELRLYPGNGPGRLGVGRVLASSTSGLSALVGAGDVDGDGRSDLIARATDGHLVSYAQGTGGALGARRDMVTDPSVTSRDFG